MNIPSHIAIIMDGNGRWAEKQNLSRTEGHRKGVENLKKIVKHVSQLNISYLTLYAFSTENWKRPGQEVDFLMKLFEQSLAQNGNELNENNVKVKIIGRKENLTSELIQEINNIENLTSSNSSLNLNIAFNYGGRAEIVDTVKKISKKNMDMDSLTIEDFQNNLYVSREVDLLIRTGGDMRISNFLLWQVAYAEIFITDTFWPDFGTKDLNKAIESYKKRERRFGGLST